MDTQPDIAGAIRRSRRSRAAMQRRRRRSAAALAALAVALAGGGIWSVGALTGHDMVEAAVAKTRSLADLLAERSPGQRTEAELTKTKHAKALARSRPRAAARAAPQPKLAMVDLNRLLEAPPVAPLFTDVQPAWPPVAFTPPSIGTIVGPPTETPPGSPPGGSPPGGSGFPGTPSKPIITVPSAVPEPGTWATMLLGFGLMGWRMRRPEQRLQIHRA